nr:putative oxidoreductase dlte [Quercus suber]
MTIKTLDFKCALVTGGGGGIGRAMSEYFLSQGKKVIIAGRTESKLQAASKEMQNCPYYVLDTGDIPAIPEFVKKITKEHPELDCLVNNAGVQRPFTIPSMEPADFLAKADQELSINISGPMHLAVNLLPHFRSKGSSGAVIMNVSSVLGYNPFSIINPVYNATKSWLHFWSMNLRTQLQQADVNVRVVEIAPPTVSTDLHRERENPDDNKKENNESALSVDEFMKEIVDGWKQDKDVVSAGMGVDLVQRWYKEFGPAYEKAASGGK